LYRSGNLVAHLNVESSVVITENQFKAGVPPSLPPREIGRLAAGQLVDLGKIPTRWVESLD
jgi:hypothetical protein